MEVLLTFINYVATMFNARYGHSLVKNYDYVKLYLSKTSYHALLYRSIEMPIKLFEVLYKLDVSRQKTFTVFTV